MNFEYRMKEQKTVCLIQQCGTCARGRVYRHTSVHIILSHKLGNTNILGQRRDSVASYRVNVIRAILQHMKATFICAAGCSRIPASHQNIHCLRALFHFSWFYISFSRSLCFKFSCTHSYLFRDFCWFPLLQFFSFYTCIFLPTLLVFLYYRLSTSSFLPSLFTDR